MPILVKDVNGPQCPKYMPKTGYSGMYGFLEDNFTHENCILFNISNNFHYHDIIFQHVKSVKYEREILSQKTENK